MLSQDPLTYFFSVSCQAICAPQSNETDCSADQILEDTEHHMYQLVYIASMVSVLAFGIIKGFTFTNTTLMASSSLHNRVFNKVGPQRAAGPPGCSVYSIQQALAVCQKPCWTLGTEALSWSLLSGFHGRLLKYHIGRPVSGSNRDTSWPLGGKDRGESTHLASESPS